MVIKKRVIKKTKAVKQSTRAEALRGLFISDDKTEYAFVVGRYMASAFSGFIAGLIVCSLVWVVIVQSFLMN